VQSEQREWNGEASGLTWRRYEPIFVVLSVLALQLTGGAGAIDDQPVPFQLVILTGAYLAAPILMAYVLLTSDTRRSRIPNGNT
jgi:hypothetical protein